MCPSKERRVECSPCLFQANQHKSYLSLNSLNAFQTALGTGTLLNVLLRDKKTLEVLRDGERWD